MTQEFPQFLSIFGKYNPTPDTATVLTDWQVEKAAVDKQTRAIKAQVLCHTLPAHDVRRRVEEELASSYRVEKVELEFRVVPSDEEDIPLPEPPGEEMAPPERHEPEGEAVAAPAENLAVGKPETVDAFRLTEELRRQAMERFQTSHSQDKKQDNKQDNKPPKEKSGKLIFGRREIKGTTTPLSSLALDMGTVVVEGDVFAINHRELKKRGAWVVSFDITDYTGSVRVNKFFLGDEGKALVDGVKEGQHLVVQGKLNMDRYTNDMVLEPYTVQLGERKIRADVAGEKRVELHLHTTMSSMDALTPTKDVVKRAENWGHRAIAITDHGVAQSFPDAWHAAKNIKILYGVEAYFINDMDYRVVVH
ncbi:MAG: PHP domain-containing protein, partial [Oscillospiraceae bacterium]|nr:PHP domain-containing protein [Oscillospiraceae bacterium]